MSEFSGESCLVFFTIFSLPKKNKLDFESLSVFYDFFTAKKKTNYAHFSECLVFLCEQVTIIFFDKKSKSLSVFYDFFTAKKKQSCYVFYDTAKKKQTIHFSECLVFLCEQVMFKFYFFKFVEIKLVHDHSCF